MPAPRPKKKKKIRQIIRIIILRANDELENDNEGTVPEIASNRLALVMASSMMNVDSTSWDLTQQGVWDEVEAIYNSFFTSQDVEKATNLHPDDTTLEGMSDDLATAMLSAGIG